MKTLAALTRNHAPACNAPESACMCTEHDRHKQEGRQYWVTGMLAFVAGLLGGGIGWHYSMAALSDALHALADGAADMWGVGVMRRIAKTPEREKRLRREGTMIIALLLAVGALFVFNEAANRFAGGGYMVSPAWIIVAGLVTGAIDLSRVVILTVAQSHAENEMRAGLIIHAAADLARSLAVMVMGVVMVAAEIFAATNIDTHLRMADLGISVILVFYMFYLAALMWRGKHHGHKVGEFVLQALAPVLRRVFNIRLHVHAHCEHGHDH